MTVPCWGYTFAPVMKLYLLLLFTVLALPVCAQDRPVSGVVADKNTQERIASVNVKNLRNGESVYNNLKAEFTISARAGDVLVFNKQGYFADTLKLQNLADLAVYLRPQAIMLKPVTIRDSMLTPAQQLAKAKAENSKAYGSLAYKDILSTSPGVGAGISIDAIWNMLSRSGRNAAHLREIIELDHKQDIIDYRFNKTFVAGITGLQEPELTRFMYRYRPSYFMVTTASDYEFISYIKANVKRFKRNPNGRYLQPLPQLNTSSAAK